MTKALRHMSKEEREKAIARRLREKTGGLGYFSALAASQKMGAKIEAQEVRAVAEEEEISEE